MSTLRIGSAVICILILGSWSVGCNEEGSSAKGAGGEGGGGETNSSADLPEPLLKFEGYTNPAWSSDGSVFTAQSTEDGGIYVLNEGGEASLLVAQADDGKWLSGALVFSYTRGAEDDDDGEVEFVLLDYSTQKETVLSGLDNVCGHAWSPDGRRLVTTVRAEEQDGLDAPRSGLRVVDLKGKESFLSDAIAGDRKCSPDWSPDGKYIYFASKTPEGEYWDREPVTALLIEDDFKDTIVEEGHESYTTGISATFDGWFFVSFTGRESSYKSVCPQSLDGKRPACLVSEEDTSMSAAWSPTDRILAATVSAPDNQLYLYDVISERKVVIYENIDDRCGDYCADWEPSGPEVSHPVWSPDGKKLAYSVNMGDDTSVQVIDVEPWLNQLD